MKEERRKTLVLEQGLSDQVNVPNGRVNTICLRERWVTPARRLDDSRTFTSYDR